MTARVPLVVLAGRSSARDMKPEGRADYVIYKDIDIEEQLAKGLTVTLGQSASMG